MEEKLLRTFNNFKLALDYDYEVIDAKRGFLTSFTSSPVMVKEAVYGYLAGLGLIGSVEDASILSIEEDESKLKGTVKVWVFWESVFEPEKPKPLEVDASRVVKLFSDVTAKRLLHGASLHSAAAYTPSLSLIALVHDFDEVTVLAKLAGHLLLSRRSGGVIVATTARPRRPSVRALVVAGVSAIVTIRQAPYSGVLEARRLGLPLYARTSSGEYTRIT